MYEVEVKFRLPDASKRGLEARLAALGAVATGTVDQEDVYFRHPARDFAKTDEALRLRREGGRADLTYKGPKIDRATKTRVEHVTPVGSAGEAEAILSALGFTKVAPRVRKTRASFSLRQFTIAIDDVEGLGRFVEFEAAADEETLGPVREELLALAAELGAGPPIRESYLELLLRNP
ncbi:MAG: class IV adenylate cyclase [Methanobacteriota archaeon]